MPFDFDYEFVRSGPPIVTLSSVGLAFNSGSRNLLGFPSQVDIGYDSQAKAIGIRAHQTDCGVEPYEFETREKDGWVRISAKEFSRYLEQQTGMSFREKAKQFLPEFDEETKTLVVILDGDHLK